MPKIFFLAGDTLDTGVSPGGTYPPAPAFRKAGRKFIRWSTSIARCRWSRSLAVPCTGLRSR
eukprot:scaffold94928_cov36-Phaeocystis_antarctica.AAC.1